MPCGRAPRRHSARSMQGCRWRRRTIASTPSERLDRVPCPRVDRRARRPSCERASQVRPSGRHHGDAAQAAEGDSPVAGSTMWWWRTPFALEEALVVARGGDGGVHQRQHRHQRRRRGAGRARRSCQGLPRRSPMTRLSPPAATCAWWMPCRASGWPRRCPPHGPWRSRRGRCACRRGRSFTLRVRASSSRCRASRWPRGPRARACRARARCPRGSRTGCRRWRYVMSNAPCDSCEKRCACTSSRNISLDSATGACPASRLMTDSSESALCGLIVRSMRCISVMTSSMALSPRAASSHHSSTRMAVPIATSSRDSQTPASFWTTCSASRGAAHGAAGAL